MRHTNLQTGAKGWVSGVVSNRATWIETFQISQNNLPIEDADTSTWEFTFKRCDSVELTLTSGSEITVTQGDIGTMFAIEVDISTSMCGDYHADLFETRADGNVVHWLHGTVSFNS
jgi:hypothetical protein